MNYRKASILISGFIFGQTCQNSAPFNNIGYHTIRFPSDDMSNCQWDVQSEIRQGYAQTCEHLKVTQI